MGRIRFRLTCALILSFVEFFEYSASYASSSDTNSQVEMRLGLQKSGYEKLARALSFQDDSEREDLYFDFFDSQKKSAMHESDAGLLGASSNAFGAFLLAQRQPPEKLRIMKKDGKLKWQYSKKLNSSMHSSEDLHAQLSQTDSVEISGKDYPDLAKLFETGADCFANLLQSFPDDHDLRARILALSADLRGRDLLMQSVSHLPKGLLVPAAFSRKIRKETNILVDKVKLHVQLGASSKIDEFGHEHTVYEIEAERDGQLNSADSQLTLHFLEQLSAAGLDLEDLDDSLVDPFSFSLSKYQELGI